MPNNLYKRVSAKLVCHQWHCSDEWGYFNGSGQYMNRSIGVDSFGVTHVVTECGLHTPRGFLRIKPYDWIVREPSGELRIYSPEDFADLFVEAT